MGKKVVTHNSKSDLPLLFLGKKIEQLSWTVFMSPFHWTLWLCILGLAIGVSPVLWIFHRFPKGHETISFTEALLIPVSSIFALGTRDANDLNTNLSAKIGLLVIFLSGTVIFYSYGGFLTSSLAIPNNEKPFSSPEGLLETNYR